MVQDQGCGTDGPRLGMWDRWSKIRDVGQMVQEVKCLINTKFPCKEPDISKNGTRHITKHTNCASYTMHIIKAIEVSIKCFILNLIPWIFPVNVQAIEFVLS
jgi:hypothetical protein